MLSLIRELTPAAALAMFALTAAPAWAQSDLARSLAATCANCHGTNGNARGDMKPLAGVSADKMLAMLADFRSGNQPATIMHQIVKGYTEDQLKLIAAYFAAQKPTAAK
jgi:cytochrome subunit of sulfide dehydrogenase